MDEDKDNAERTPVDAMLFHIQKEMFPDGALNTCWVLTTEWITPDGDYYVVNLTDQQSPPWHHVGLLNKALSDFDYELIEAEDEDD